MPIVIPSKKQLDEERPQFALLPNDDYKLKIEDISEAWQDNYNREVDENGDVIQEKIAKVTMVVVSYRDGSPCFDTDGKDATGRKVFFTARPNSIGFKGGTAPAITRVFIACASGQSINDELRLESWNDIIGRMVEAELTQVVRDGKSNYMKVVRFLAPKSARPKPQGGEDIPVVEDDQPGSAMPDGSPLPEEP